MRPMRKLLSLLLFVYWAPSLAADFDPEPLRQIRAEAGSNCAVEPLESALMLIGNNGSRVDRWKLETCAGRVTYEVSYYPPQFFPDRSNPYSVRRIGGPLQDAK